MATMVEESSSKDGNLVPWHSGDLQLWFSGENLYFPSDLFCICSHLRAFALAIPSDWKPPLKY